MMHDRLRFLCVRSWEQWDPFYTGQAEPHSVVSTACQNVLHLAFVELEVKSAGGVGFLNEVCKTASVRAASKERAARMPATPTGSASSTPRTALGELSNRADPRPCSLSPRKTPRQGSPRKTPRTDLGAAGVAPAPGPAPAPANREDAGGGGAGALPAALPLAMQQVPEVPDDARDLLDMDDLFPELAAGRGADRRDAVLLTTPVAERPAGALLAQAEHRLSEDLQCLSEMSPEALPTVEPAHAAPPAHEAPPEQAVPPEQAELPARGSPRVAPEPARRRTSGIKGPARRSLTPRLDTPGSSAKPITPAGAAGSALPAPSTGSSVKKSTLESSDARACPQESSAAPTKRKTVPALALHKVGLARDAQAQAPPGAAPATAEPKIPKLAVEAAKSAAAAAGAADTPPGASTMAADGSAGGSTAAEGHGQGGWDGDARLPNCTLQSKLPRYKGSHTPRFAAKAFDTPGTSRCAPAHSLQHDAPDASAAAPLVSPAAPASSAAGVAGIGQGTQDGAAQSSRSARHAAAR